jgi:PAB1-binding protein PBP1
LAVGPSRMNDDFTDGGISRGATGANRELVAWQPEEGDSAVGMTLEEEARRGGAAVGGGGAWGKKAGASKAQWDQFSANKKLFGVDTKFDESMYTTSIDKSKAGISEAEAARIAYEIQNQISDNPHMAEERGQKDIADYDEEERYSSVLPSGKPSVAAAPAKPAWGSGKVPSTVAQHAEKRPEAAKKEEAAKPVDVSKSKLNPNAKSFTLSAKATEFVPSFKKSPAVAPQTAMPQMVMYPGYPQMQGQMMYMPHMGQMGMGMPPQMRGMMPGMPPQGQQGARPPQEPKGK